MKNKKALVMKNSVINKKTLIILGQNRSGIFEKRKQVTFVKQYF